MPTSSIPAVEISPCASREDQLAFQRLNEEWISRYFVLEVKDREVLENPESSILAKGGQIYIVRLRDVVVGCVALIPMGDGVYELSKMAVDEAYRGLGIGRKLLESTIAEARAMGARLLVLGSNTRLANAVRLYESVGFQHVLPERIPGMEYKRANVFMEMQLNP